MFDQGIGHRVTTQADHLAAQALGQLLRGLQITQARFVTLAAGVHMHHRPRQMTALSHPTGMPHQALGLGIAVDAEQQPTAHGRRFLTLQAITPVEVSIHPRRSGLHGQFAQGGEVGLAEKRIDGRTRLFGYIHLAFAQALKQLARWQVDQQDLVGFLQHPVR